MWSWRDEGRNAICRSACIAKQLQLQCHIGYNRRWTWCGLVTLEWNVLFRTFLFGHNGMRLHTSPTTLSTNVTYTTMRMCGTRDQSIGTAVRMQMLFSSALLQCPPMPTIKLHRKQNRAVSSVVRRELNSFLYGIGTGTARYLLVVQCTGVSYPLS